MIMTAALLVCCSLLHIPSQTPLGCGENLTRPEPQNIEGSRILEIMETLDQMADEVSEE